MKIKCLFILMALFISFNALAASGTLKIYNEWGDEVSYKLSNPSATSGILDPDDVDSIYISDTKHLDKMQFTYIVDGDTHSRTLNHTCGRIRGKHSGLEYWLQKTRNAAIYISYPGRGDHPVFNCRAS